MAKQKTYSEKLKDPRWQKKRLEVLNRDEFTCRLCGETKGTLVVHHVKYNGEPWEANNIHLITVCEKCHDELEAFKKIKSEGYTLNEWIADYKRVLHNSEVYEASFNIVRDAMKEIYEKSKHFFT